MTGAAGAADVAGILGGIVGADRVRPARPEDDIRGVAPRVVVAPGDEGEVAAVLKAASDRGLAVIPRGGGTKRDWGRPPERADILLSTERLSRIVEHPWADLTVTVQAGCTVRTLQDALRVHGQRVAADPLWPDAATVGGVLSANDTGALRLRFGGWRDLVIGTTLALADGTLARSGGKVVKNVAGYDLSKLVTGAFGTLGVVTTAVFRLHPIPRSRQTLSAALGDAGEAQRLMLALQDSQLAHTSLQMRAASGEPPVVDLAIEGTPAGVEAQTRDARGLARPAQLDSAQEDVWQARERLWSDDASGPIVKVGLLMTNLAGTLGLVHRLAGAAGATWAAVVQATGVGWIRFGGPPAGWAGLVRSLRAAIEQQDGSLTILRPASAGDPSEVWGDAGPVQALMTAVKREFDPGRTLNPGRFVGEI